MSKDSSKPNEGHDHTGAIKYVPESEVKAGQILVPCGFRPPFLRLKLASVDSVGPMWVAKHDVSPARGHRVGIATRWSVFENVQSAAVEGPLYIGCDGNPTSVREDGGVQVGVVLSKGTILLEPGAWGPREKPQPPETQNREPDAETVKNGPPKPPLRK